MKEMMKDSGIQWIGKIPEHWKVSQLRYFSNIVRGGSPRPIQEFLSDNVSDLPWIKIGDSEKGSKYINKTQSRLKPIGYAYTTMVNKGDLILSNSMSYGQAYILNINGCIHDGWLAFKNITGINQEYLYYSLLSSSAVSQFDVLSDGGVVQNLNIDKVKEVIIAYPPLTEQRTITSFLDSSCAKVDGIIADLEHQVDLLKEYKKSLITETVTKGLDKHVKLKDSGITWIGEIPEHWKVTKVKFLSSYIGSGTTPDSAITEYYDGTNPWIQSGDLYKTSIISKTEKLVTNLAIKNFSALKIYKAPFVVIAMYGASVGNVSVSHINACVNQACCVIITSHELNHLYLYYWLTVCKEDFNINAIGGGQPNISQQVIKNQYLLKVPLPEQQAIADFLDTRCAEIDSIIKGKEKQIEQQKEYKKSLIYEYVTGKKRVKEVY